MLATIIEDYTSIRHIADCIEFYLCVTDGELSKAELTSRLEKASAYEPMPNFIDDVWGELSERLRLYGNPPPFELDCRLVKSSINWKDHPAYLMCIILSIDGNSVETAKTGKLFERLSCEALKNYFGGEAIVYGFPKKHSVKEICACMHERFASNHSSKFKDRGVDIICWKPFGDGRKSQLAAIVQCAAGHNWSKKLLNVPIDAWRQYILWSGTLPIKGFTTPVIIDNSDFHDVVVDGGLMLDRPRLYRNICSIPYSDTTLQRDLVNWCQARIGELYYCVD